MYFQYMYFIIISPWKIHSFKQTWNHFTHRCFVLSLVVIGPVFGKRTFKKIKNFVDVFMLFLYHLRLENGVALHLKKKLNSLYAMLLFAKLVETSSVVLEKKIKMWKVYGQKGFLNIQKGFATTHTVSPIGKGHGP